jgi:hypothetical protein
MDPFNATINYTHDTAGRVTSITGTPFGAITSYTSNTQYRTWGAIKQLNYGDSRMLTAFAEKFATKKRARVSNVQSLRITRGA